MELLPCPFCGSINLGQTEYRYSSEIYCQVCNGSCDSDKWNTRHSPWISVKDKLPDTDYVIGYALSEYASNWYVGMLRYSLTLINCPFWDDSSNSHPRKVTHWQPFPQPPKEQEL